MRAMQSALTEAERNLANNRDPEAIVELQLTVTQAQDNFDLAEANALQAEYFYNLLKEQQEEDAWAYAEQLREEAERIKIETEERIDELYYDYMDLYYQYESVYYWYAYYTYEMTEVSYQSADWYWYQGYEEYYQDEMTDLFA